MYNYFIPSANLMGAGCAAQVGREAKAIGGSKALVVSDKSLMDIGITQKIVAHLNIENVETVIFDDVSPNPTVENVHDGFKLYKSEKCNFIVAVGGGSPIDCAKGIGLVVTNGGSIKNFEGLDQSEYAMPPFIAVNTTAGTGSEMTRFTIITDTDRHVKMAQVVDYHGVEINLAVGKP